MHVTVVYESMFGNTRMIAARIAQGIRTHLVDTPNRVVVLSLAEVTDDDIARAQLLVVGSPTHAHGLSRPGTRAEAAAWSKDPHKHLDLEPTATGDGVREWLDRLPAGDGLFAAFDTRADIPKLLSGAASHAIARRLEHSGRRQVLEPESFRVTTDNHAEPDELTRAGTWGKSLALACEGLARSESDLQEAAASSESGTS